MTEDQISVGPLRYIWTHFILCKISRYSPFKTLCSSFIFGSFLASCCHKRCTSFLTWYRLFRVLGLVCSLLIITLPYVVRVYIISNYEEFYYGPLLSLSNLFKWYFGSGVTLLIFYEVSPIRFKTFILTIFNDMKHKSCLQCLQTFLFHLLRPLEALGLFGVILAPIYCFFLLPFLVVRTIFYCIPTLYILCRLIFYRLPGFGKCKNAFCKKRRTLIVQSRKSRADNASKHVITTLNENIEFGTLSTKGDLSNKTRMEYPWYVRIIVGIVASIFMCIVLYMYAECFHIVIKVGTLTFLGTIVNIDSIGN